VVIDQELQIFVYFVYDLLNGAFTYYNYIVFSYKIISA